MNKTSEAIALADMDNTLFDYDGAMRRDMDALAAPGEPPYTPFQENSPPHIEARRRLIAMQPDWWFNLKPLKLGADIVRALMALDYEVHVLTKGPEKKPAAWSEKLRSVSLHYPLLPLTIVQRDKGLTYGKVLCDDYPPYLLRWLEWRPRGFCIMPAYDYNKDFQHPNVLRVDGSNYDHMFACLKYVRHRPMGEPLQLPKP